jgi:hypothetical protein
MKDPQPDKWKITAIVALSVLGLAMFAAVATPNLLRSRMAANSASRLASLKEAFSAVQAAERKLAKIATVELLVEDLDKATSAIEAKLPAYNAEVTNYAQTSETNAQMDRVMLQVRVPANRLDEFLADMHRVATRVESEAIETADVTTEFVDTDAKLRNLAAAEQQYLSLLKQSHSVEETLKVTQALNSTRTEIDRIQGELNVLNQRVETSLVKITLRRDAEARILGVYWRPAANFKRAVRDLLSGFADYADAVVSFFVQLPIFVLWLVTVLVLIAWGLRIALAFFRFFNRHGWFRVRLVQQ